LKTKDKQRLYADLIKYSDQIGIYPEERPRLMLDRKEYHALKVANGEPKRAGWYGECNRELQTIFLDAGKRYYHYGIYRKLRKNSNEQEMYKDVAKGYGYRNQVIYHNTTDYSSEDNRQTYYRFHHDGKHYTETREAKGNYKSKLHCMISLLVYYRSNPFHDSISLVSRALATYRTWVAYPDNRRNWVAFMANLQFLLLIF
jgi:hypothetical protein